jgi:hypothetical protein
VLFVPPVEDMANVKVATSISRMICIIPRCVACWIAQRAAIASVRRVEPPYLVLQAGYKHVPTCVPNHKA